MMGDEFHYVCECENAQIVELREKCLPKYYKTKYGKVCKSHAGCIT